MSNIRRKTLAEERPDLVPEWSEKNLPLTPDRISAFQCLNEICGNARTPFFIR